MKTFFVACCLLIGAIALPRREIDSEEWTAFKAQYGKTYSTPEEEMQRMTIYMKNKEHVEKHNELYRTGQVSYHLELNHLADIERNEMRKTNKRPVTSTNAPVHVNTMEAPPPSVDWRTTPGVVPDVQYMAMCESSWAFSAIGSMTGQLALKKGLHFPQLSVQNLVDCTFYLGNSGCEGGNVYNAFNYIEQNGIESEDDYFYRTYDSNCLYNQSLAVPGAKVTGFIDISPGSEDDLLNAVATVGPVSVTVGAYDNNFMFYKGGIYNPAPETCTTDPHADNHAVLLVGYGSLNNQNFWIIQNYWGGSWGENGYMRLFRNGTNLCGIASQATYPTV